MLDTQNKEPKSQRSTSKEPLDDAAVGELLHRASAVLVAKGKKIQEFPSSTVTLDALKGPTGNYRAPILLIGKKLLVGFHAETLEELI